MCKIIFSDGNSQVFIAKDLKFEDSIQFALNLHRSSNFPHTIYVTKDDVPQSLLILKSE